MALGAVRVTGAPARAEAAPLATIVDAIRVANAGTACPSAARALLAAVAGDPPGSLTATAVYATFTSSVGVSGSAPSARAIAAAIASAAFPLTAAAWAPAWGYSVASWAAAFGAPPVGVVAGSIAIVDTAPSSTQLAVPAAGLTTSQQLGLGLGVGLALASIVAAAAAVWLACCSAPARDTRAANQLLVVVDAAAEAAAKRGDA